jgi:hypothetical protein
MENCAAGALLFVETKGVSSMTRTAFLLLTACIATTAQAQAQSLPDTIIAPDRAVPTVNQVLSGTWLSELRRPGPAASLPPIPVIVTFFSDGTSLASPSDGTQTATHGIWLRVGDRKFLGTGFFFVFDTNRVLTTVTKVRINYELAPDGKTLTGTTEAVVFDPTGKVLTTLAGASFTMLRLSFEIPGDFYDFQKLP